jgi:hypothetical protein
MGAQENATACKRNAPEWSLSLPSVMVMVATYELGLSTLVVTLGTMAPVS